MDKENVRQSPAGMPRCITEEQRSRISQKFRTAKTLLPRQRLPDVTEVSKRVRLANPEKNGVVNDRITPCNAFTRYPLVEIQTKTPSPTSLNSSYLSHERYQCSSKSIRYAIQEKGIKERRASEDESEEHSYSISSILDEDLDETIFREIDNLCEQISSAKKEAPLSSKTQENHCYECYISDSANHGERSEKHQFAVDSFAKSGIETSTIPSGIDIVMPEAYSEYLKLLNDEQRDAACSDISTPLIIVAGPGSGKTSTMVGRILTLLREGIAPSNILAMTFTTAAATEMRERIGAVVGKSMAKELTMSTFHSFCLPFCRLHAEKLGRTPEFIIYGHAQQKRAIIEAVRLTENARKNAVNFGNCEIGQSACDDRENVQSFKDKSKKWQKFVVQTKASGKTPADCKKMGDEIGASILQNYDDILKSCNALDYHDFINSSVNLLSDFPEVYKESQNSWKAIVVDEFQDTSVMQYRLLYLLASHNRVTVVGDEDQSIYSFNGANTSGFDLFRKDFPAYKEIRLNKNYRSTRCIVEASTSLIQNNSKGCRPKEVVTDNSSGYKVYKGDTVFVQREDKCPILFETKTSPTYIWNVMVSIKTPTSKIRTCLASDNIQITIEECTNEESQCSFVIDKILEFTSENSSIKYSFKNIAVLYRRQATGRIFQKCFRDRKIPFNVHGVAFYRKKVIKAIMSLIKTALHGCDDASFRYTFKIIDYIDKISNSRKSSFFSTASDILRAKVSGTLKRSQLAKGRKVLLQVDMISKMVQRETSISEVITSVANMLPQKYLLEQRAIFDTDGGHFLNEDNDLRSVLQYLLDDASDFLSSHFNYALEEKRNEDGHESVNVVKAFVDYVTSREKENFLNIKNDNKNSITLTTIHQSKGLEWDIVFIMKVNESEIPLLHEFNGFVIEGNSTLEEERRLLYVAMTRARKKLYISYVIMDSNWQLLQPSRFLKEIPDHLVEIHADFPGKDIHVEPKLELKEPYQCIAKATEPEPPDCYPVFPSVDHPDAYAGNSFLKKFSLEGRSTISHLFHHWAKKQAFQEPRRLLTKVGFVIDERLRSKTTKYKDILRALKLDLECDEALCYAQYVLKWEQIPADKRSYLVSKRQEHFQKLRMENAMKTSAATSKQIAYLKSLGCTTIPTSRLHASQLIEQYRVL